MEQSGAGGHLFNRHFEGYFAEKSNDRLYIQVTESMQSLETCERELRPLRMIPDNYEKIVLSMDRSYIVPMMGLRL